MESTPVGSQHECFPLKRQENLTLPLIPGTQEVSSTTFTLSRRQITLIDNPGFDDSSRSDADILKLIAAHMAATHAQGALLTGIIILHSINHARLLGSEVRRTAIFKKLLGEGAYKRVVIATTMWNRVDETDAAAWQEQRAGRHDVWGDMVAKGGRVVRHDNNRQSALRIIQDLVRFEDPVELQIQRELQENGGRLELTSVGRQLSEQLNRTIARLREEIKELQAERVEMGEAISELKKSLAQCEGELEEMKSRNRRWCVVM